MMRKYLFAIILSGISLYSMAQHAVGVTTVKPYVGLSYAAMFNGDLDFRRGVAVGIDLEKRLAKWFAVSGGLAYAPLGGRYNDSYITMPITANFYPVRGLAFKVGLQPGLSIGNRQEGTGNSMIVMRDMDGDVKSYDLAAPVAVSYELYNIVLDVRWNIGLMSVGSSNPWRGSSSMHDSHLSGANFAYQFTIGYQFEM